MLALRLAAKVQGVPSLLDKLEPSKVRLGQLRGVCKEHDCGKFGLRTMAAKFSSVLKFRKGRVDRSRLTEGFG